MDQTHLYNGRDTKGRFGEGNSFGKGRPKLETERYYLHAVREACDFETWKAIVSKSVEQAKEGDAKARTFLASYLIGKPEQKIVALEDTNDNGEKVDTTFASEEEERAFYENQIDEMFKEFMKSQEV